MQTRSQSKEILCDFIIEFEEKLITELEKNNGEALILLTISHKLIPQKNIVVYSIDEDDIDKDSNIIDKLDEKISLSSVSEKINNKNIDLIYKFYYLYESKEMTTYFKIIIVDW